MEPQLRLIKNNPFAKAGGNDNAIKARQESMIVPNWIVMTALLVSMPSLISRLYVWSNRPWKNGVLLLNLEYTTRVVSKMGIPRIIIGTNQEMVCDLSCGAYNMDIEARRNPSVWAPESPRNCLAGSWLW
jgi:hypothetical protein